jgi:hypothetical protein
MKSFDDSIKFLVEKHPAEFLSFALRGARVHVLKPLSAVLPARSRTVDDAFLVEINKKRRVAHMEYVRRCSTSSPREKGCRCRCWRGIFQGAR